MLQFLYFWKVYLVVVKKKLCHFFGLKSKKNYSFQSKEKVMNYLLLQFTDSQSQPPDIHYAGLLRSLISIT